MGVHFFEELTARDLVAQVTHPQELTTLLAPNAPTPFRPKEPRANLGVYCGFDPTAPSLHVGNLVLLMALRRAQQKGLTPVVLFGGATGLIGDPTGRTEMRQMRTEQDIEQFIRNFQHMTLPLFNQTAENPPLFLNNIQWTQGISWLDFLRNIGVHFNVSRLLSAEVNRSRLEHGLTFMEMGYQLLQAFDFLHLHKNYNCKIQLGGNDQWSNILAGVELIRKVTGEDAYAVTLPLLVGSDGRKYGKSAGNAIWLDPNMTSPYEFFQFFRNIADADVGLFYRVFSDLSVQDMQAELATTPINSCKEQLAFEVTRLVHGPGAANQARGTARSLFSKEGGTQPESIQERAKGAPETRLRAQDIWPNEGSDTPTPAVPLDLMGLVLKTGLVSSRSEARKLIEGGGLSLNEEKVQNPFLKLQISLFSANGGLLLLRKGKKDYHAVYLET